MSGPAKCRPADGSAGDRRRFIGLAGQVAGLLLLLGMAYLWHHQAAPVRQFDGSRQRRGTRDLIRNDDDLLRYDAGINTPMLGKDAVIFDALCSEFPPGTPVKVCSMSPRTPLEWACGGFVQGRIQRLWLALIPRYKLAQGSQLVVICPRVWIDPELRYEDLRLVEDKNGPVNPPRLLTTADYDQVRQFRAAELGDYTILAKGEHLVLLKRRHGGAP